MVNTAELKPGQKVRLIAFGETEHALRRKLLAFGVTTGVLLDVIRAAPLGCPILFEVRGTCFALRKEEARHLQWENVVCE